MKKRKLHPLRWFIWALAAAFYYYEYVLRVSPSVMVPELERSFAVSAGAIGTLSAFYFYAYAPMQLPIGILMDRFGARRLLVLATALCGIGGLAFGFAPHLPLAEAGRFLMGTGSAFAFIGMIYICHQWFPNRWVAVLIGLGNSIGMLGAVMGEGPLSFGVDYFGWRAIAIALGGIGLLMSALIFIAMRRSPPSLEQHVPTTRWRELFGQVKVVCLNPQTWVNAVGNMFFYATVVAFAALWGVPFIQVAYGVDNHVAAFASSMIFVGFIVGGPLVGFISDHLRRRKIPLLFTSLFAFFSLTPVIYLTDIPIGGVYALLFLTGVFSSGTLLNFSLVTAVNPPEAKGTAIAFTNTIAFIGGALFQTAVGLLLDTFWKGVAKGGVIFYAKEAYQVVLSIFPITLLLAFLIFLALKEPMRGRRGSVEKALRP